MCRMFGLVAARAVALADLLAAARTWGREHRDGWGVAIHDGDWRLDRDTASAACCARFAALVTSEARLAIAHVRKKTVGDTSLANTHPFSRGRFVFAHNGTVPDLAALAARTAPEHAAAIAGDTDSERLFAFVLTHIDEAGDVARGIAAAVRSLHAIADAGSASFLMSCGSRLYAHRLGRALFTLSRRDATFVASEPVTAEPWHELADRELAILDVPAPGALAA
jgi:glutamine amidotransferase